MTPKEKAVELVNKMRLFYGEFLDADNEPKNNYKIQRSYAKQCALIAVDEILNVLRINTGYWQHVKDEIKYL